MLGLHGGNFWYALQIHYQNWHRSEWVPGSDMAGYLVGMWAQSKLEYTQCPHSNYSISEVQTTRFYVCGYLVGIQWVASWNLFTLAHSLS